MSSHLRARKILEQVVNIKTISSKKNNQIHTVIMDEIVNMQIENSGFIQIDTLDVENNIVMENYSYTNGKININIVILLL